jgi:hypothetical protein
MRLLTTAVGMELCVLSHLTLCFVPVVCVLSHLALCIVPLSLCFVPLLGLSIRNVCIRKRKSVRKSLSKPAAYGWQVGARLPLPDRRTPGMYGKEVGA